MVRVVAMRSVLCDGQRQEGIFSGLAACGDGVSFCNNLWKVDTSISYHVPVCGISCAHLLTVLFNYGNAEKNLLNYFECLVLKITNLRMPLFCLLLPPLASPESGSLDEPLSNMCGVLQLPEIYEGGASEQHQKKKIFKNTTIIGLLVACGITVYINFCMVLKLLL